ncbi:hypothetical protein GCM10009687_15740 [Asanoa iriomotensis]|uniref:Uncharacterized protein n=1 Tax=Asanoa iriomotensis TaxID=234613 RepID=A0ABQ4C0G9_9ACTN|nr:hypothetical protein Air01nite_23660 [Asanoa iriomotensis]
MRPCCAAARQPRGDPCIGGRARVAGHAGGFVGWRCAVLGCLPRTDFCFGGGRFAAPLRGSRRRDRCGQNRRVGRRAGAWQRPSGRALRRIKIPPDGGKSCARRRRLVGAGHDDGFVGGRQAAGLTVGAGGGG